MSKIVRLGAACTNGRPCFRITPKDALRNRNIDPRARIRDSLFIAFTVVVSSLPYLNGLGFYSDDWYYSALFEACGDQSTPGLFKCLFASEQYRPGHILELALLHRIFGLNPLPYHVWGMCLHTLCAILLYLVLSKIQLQRKYGLAIVLLWAALPHYSTDRFWIASLQAALSLAMFLAGVLAALRPDAQRAGRAAFTALSLFALVASALTYEVCFPLIALLPFLLWYQAREKDNASHSFRTYLKSAAPCFYGLAAVVLGVVLFKLSTHNRIPTASQFERLASVRTLAAHAVRQTIDFNYGVFGAGLPAMAWQAIVCRLNSKSIFAAFAVGIFIFLYLSVVADGGERQPTRRLFLWMIASGLVLFGLGYSIFAAFPKLDLANLGITNRINIASAVGVAVSWIGIFSLASSFLPSPKVAARCFALLVALFATSGLVVVEGAASYWVAATREQEIILDDLRNRFPEPPRNAVILIDGVCAYVGPAPAFKTNWDTSGAVRLLYKKRFDLRGDLVAPGMEIGNEGVTLWIDRFKNTYSYADPLFVYNYKSKQLERLSNRAETLRYVATPSSSFNGGCGAREGYGTPACFSGR